VVAAVPKLGSPVRFEILGPVRAVRDGRELDLGPAKQRAVLAVLLLGAGQPQPTHRIVDAVWGDEPPENGANVVQKYVAGLRRVLDPDRSPRTPGELLALTPAGYVLHVGAGALDVEQFEAGVARAATERAADRLPEASRTLRHALGLWRGTALGGLSGAAFDAARDRLTDAHATAWESWAEIELARGNHSVLVPDLIRLVAEFPLREGLRALLMLALARGGRQAEALAVFREARRYLDEEFGVEPGERLQETHRRILRSDASAGGRVAPRQAAPPTALRSPGTPAGTATTDPAPGPSAEPAANQAGAPPGVLTGPALPPVEAPWPVPLSYPGPPGPDRRFVVLGVVLAAMVPLLTCGLGGWVFIGYLAAIRRDGRQLVAAAGYLAVLLANIAFTPWSDTGEDMSARDVLAFGTFIALAVVGAVHAAILAARVPGAAWDHDHERLVRREHARRLLLW
jgi:DNA-binding SARP family transcriptional activator